MEKGMAIIERNDIQTKAIFIDYEAIEFARQNARTNKRVADAKDAKHKAKKAQERKRAFIRNTIAYMLTRGGVIVAAAVAANAGLVHPVISAPVIILCLCAVCIRFGLWLGKVGVKNA